MTNTLTPAEKAERRTAARAEHKALVAWEQNGSEGDRPETPNYDAIVAESAKGGSKTKKEKGERKPRECPIDDEVRQVMTDGTHSHPVTVGEIAKSIDRPSSSTQHAIWRMLATGELVKTEGRPARHWHRDMGDMPEVPKAEAPAQRERKAYKGESKSGTVHDCTRRKIEGTMTLVPNCVSEGSKIPALEATDGETTCKKCTKLAEAAA